MVEDTAELENVRERATNDEEEEVVIEFEADGREQDNMSALSHSMGKRWEDEESMVV